MRKLRILVLLAVIVSLSATAAPAQAQGGTFITRLRAFEEVPSIASPGNGTFRGTLNEDGTEMEYVLTYARTEGAVTQAHIHLAQRGVNGGIMVFLCSNLGNAPAGTPACPQAGGTVTGSFSAEDIIGPAAQGVAPGELFTLLRASRAGFAYVNVHSTVYPGGEIRGQLQALGAAGGSGDEAADFGSN
ncbi:MAG TPA: CHRD domain-containing protein [Thermoanaerobaculia bacterium]|nr:CHRD domain-containing protein [Thermoanaerobaculia bacterium]